VDFYVNGKLLGSLATAPYTYAWKVPAKRGKYTIAAKAYSASGNAATHSIAVNVQ
jgi:hypothetical protein